MMAWAASCPCVVFCSFHRPPSTSISLLLLLLLLLLCWCSASAALPFSCIPYTPGRIRIFEAREPLYFREISLSIIRTDRQTALLFCFLSTLSYLESSHVLIGLAGRMELCVCRLWERGR
jgi:hypothetical protein